MSTQEEIKEKRKRMIAMTKPAMSQPVKIEKTATCNANSSLLVHLGKVFVR